MRAIITSDERYHAKFNRFLYLNFASSSTVPRDQFSMVPCWVLCVKRIELRLQNSEEICALYLYGISIGIS
jgi:hypothetical protein